MMRIDVDTAARLQATDPHNSFIVQAPAGSGKTEILTQRYLRLLSHVETPEQIVALTFTRKAAFEMRARILAALTQAHTPPTSAHQAQTYAYAQDALKRDAELNWGLSHSPSRLRIMTIDSLCQRLLQAIPLEDKQSYSATIAEHPYRYYLAAARACLQEALADPLLCPAIQHVLEHLDNRQDRLFELFCQLLIEREQWLPLLYQAREQNKATFEQALALIETHELTRFRQTLPDDIAETLLSLAREVACLEARIDSPRAALRNWSDWNAFTGEQARSLCALLLTSQQTLRKAFDHHVGLRRDACPADRYVSLKAASKMLLATLEELPDCLAALLRIQYLPQPRYDLKQWHLLQALFQLLPRLTAHLHLLFQHHHCLDFTAVAQGARLALGSSDAPTDLALYLDHQLQHLLIDEFQDTSIQQFQLLTQLVSGFEAQDGRTVFVVGDPMQSIYRFRAAEVGLFLRAQQYGLGPVALTALQLTRNFRSASTLVDWVNTQFMHIFPRQNDMASGAISYHQAVATRPSDTSTHVKAIQCDDHLAQAIQLVETIQHCLTTYPEDDIALLVRSRHQLKPILRQLHEANIPFQGVDIDLLTTLPHIQDTWILTEALLMPGNRLAWLSLLRSPWCGLTLADIHLIATVDPHLSIYAILAEPASWMRLSTEGQTRIAFIYPILQQALSQRATRSLVDWVRHTQQQLHGDLQLTRRQRDDLEQYWQLLDAFDEAGCLVDRALFQQAFQRLYAKQATPSRLHIMTIHKSKGLEFDTILLPGLSRAVSERHPPFLRWLQLPTEDRILHLCSPLKAAEDDHDELYRYLSKIEAEKQHYEIQRLLYVALTRAKKRLFLFDHGTSIRKGSFRSLLQMPFIEAPSVPETPLNVKTDASTLWRLPTTYYTTPPLLTPPPSQSLPLAISSTLPRLIGILTHELLQWIGTHHPETLETVPFELCHYRIKQWGLPWTLHETVIQTIRDLLHPLFHTERGRWIMQPHLNEQNEYALQIKQHGRLLTRILDRTFDEKGRRWIIDFKTGHDTPEQQEAHQQQLQTYATLLQHRIKTPIHCGLFYLSQAHWVEYVFSKSGQGFSDNVQKAACIRLRD